MNDEADRSLLPLDAIQEYLDGLTLGAGEVTASRIGDGRSNLTYLLRRSGVEVVLRRPPPPPLLPSTHDVIREARLQRSLRDAGVAVPEILAICDDASIIGAPFYLMPYLRGHVITNSLPDSINCPVRKRRLMASVVTALAAIHAVDIERPDIQPFVRQGSYLERQVRRFSSLWEQSEHRDIPDVDSLTTWLRANIPVAVRSTVVHGDFRLGNIMVRADVPDRVLAVLDWELGAVGDPRADIGYLLATYSDASSHRTALELSPVTALPGFPTRGELLEWYAAESGSECGSLAWFEAFALWKGAIFCEEIYTRHLRTDIGENPFAAGLEAGVARLAAAAILIAGT